MSPDPKACHTLASKPKSMDAIKLFNRLILIILMISSSEFAYMYINPFDINPRSIDKNVSIGIPKIFMITVRNIGFNVPFHPQSRIRLNYEVEGFHNWIIINENRSTELSNGNTKFIQVKIYVPNTTNPGNYNGEILVNDTRGHSKRIPLSLEVIK